MKLITVKMPEAYIEAIDELVKKGRFATRSEAIRVAIRELLRREMIYDSVPEDEETEWNEEETLDYSEVI